MAQDKSVTLKMVQFEIQEGNFDRAINLLYPLAEQESNNPTIWLMIGECKLRSIFYNPIELYQKNVAIVSSAFNYFERTTDIVSFKEARDYEIYILNLTNSLVNELRGKRELELQNANKNFEQAKMFGLASGISNLMNDRNNFSQALIASNNANTSQQYYQEHLRNSERLNIANDIITNTLASVKKFIRDLKGYYSNEEMETIEWNSLTLDEQEKKRNAINREIHQKVKREIEAKLSQNSIYNEQKKGAAALIENKEYKKALSMIWLANKIFREVATALTTAPGNHSDKELEGLRNLANNKIKSKNEGNTALIIIGLIVAAIVIYFKYFKN